MSNASHDYFDLEQLNPSNVAMYNVGRLRTDMWHFLRDSARRLHRIAKLDDSGAVGEIETLSESCREVFQFLLPIFHFLPIKRKIDFKMKLRLKIF